MAAYYTSQAYDAPARVIWPILTDFPSWPSWFPRLSSVRVEDAGAPGVGVRLRAFGDAPDAWTSWRIDEWREPGLLVCRHIESNAPMAPHVQAAHLQFELFDDPEGCTLEVEIGAQGYGLVGDLMVGVTVGQEVRRMLPQLVDAFSDHVVQRTAAGT